MKNNLLSIGCILSIIFAFGQDKDITTNLYDTYEQYQEATIGKRRIKYSDIQPLISQYAKNPKFIVQKVGESIEGRNLSLISIGSGNINVFLWSQMHGNEPTATQAIFDILNFLDGQTFAEEKKEILSHLTLHFLPMLNPDGAEVYQRRNALGIDINRDALRLQSPEGKTLKKVRDSLNADFGFNLHDQSTYYNAEFTNKPATISYLATAYNYEKDMNDVRANAMKVIVYMNNIIQKYAPGQVGRYSDDFEPRAFGDNIAKWGTSLILIESGGYTNDIEKQEIRKLNYVSIISALHTIANGSYNEESVEDYEKIPQNDRKLFDLKIENVTYELLGKEYLLDLGIYRLEVDNENHNDFYYSSRIMDQGDLSTFYGYETLNAKGYKVKVGKVFPKIFPSIKGISKLDITSLLKLGYAYLKVANISLEEVSSKVPLHIVSTDFKQPKLYLEVGINPTFFLEKDGELAYAVINGFLIDLNSEKSSFKNAMIIRERN
ncbi:MAG: peptidase M14 [Flavobacteriaceae bacterium]|nr:MAG: peptidase M14 [Flavobacteriaceae bacterium]